MLSSMPSLNFELKLEDWQLNFEQTVTVNYFLPQWFAGSRNITAILSQLPPVDSRPMVWWSVSGEQW